MRKLHLIMPMGGKGSRFSEYGYDFPKPLLKIQDYPFFYWATQSVVKFIDVEDIIFVILKEHVEKFGLDNEIRKYYPDAKIHIIPKVLGGAVLTCMEGIREISDDAPIVFNDCDHIFRSRDFEDFCANGLDASVEGAILTFQSNEEKYSFLRFDDRGNVIETVEKKAISGHAICGCYYFANKDLFASAVETYLHECSYQEYFVSGVYNVMSKQGAEIRAFATDFHVPFGIPEEYEKAKDLEYFAGLA
ncbi:MAG: glycosyltransferase family 2 protein [Blautia sp.]|nr:glycosyltransferase family 2 protein [Blautia sp.]